MEKKIREVQMELLEKDCAKELEILHDVDIQTDAVDLACSIVGRYYDAIMCKGGRRDIPDAEMLKVEALSLLEKACLELKDDKDAELEDRMGYMMFRNLVELSEFRKEKPQSAGLSYLSHLEKENEILRHSWDGFVEKCKSVLVWQKNPKRMAQLVQLRERVCQILKSEITGDEMIPALQDLHTLLNECKRSIPATIMQYRTVNPYVVAKIASLVTGVPNSWLLNSFQPPVVCLRDKLTRKMVGQDYAIKRIANILSRPQLRERGPLPPASFLFLLSSYTGTELFFESLAEELYDSKDRLKRFNLNLHAYGSSSSDVDLRDKLNAIRDKVLEVVKNTPFCAVLFENVNECEYSTAFLEDILKRGKLVDNEGNTYELSNTLIMVSSIIGGSERRALSCKCLEMDCPMVEAAWRNISSKDLECDRLSLHRKVLSAYEYIHPLVDDVLVLNHMRPLEPEVITRVQLRKAIDASRKHQELILYPSEAVVQFVFNSSREAGLRSCLKKAIVPVIRRDLNGIQAHYMATIHMDVLVASKAFSYRSIEIDSALEAFKESLSRWKIVYQNEKRSAMEIVKLSTMCFQLLSLMQNMNEPDQVTLWLKDMENVLDGIVSNPVNSSNFLSEQNLVPPKIEAKVAHRLTDYSDSNIMEGLRVKLSSALGAEYHLLNFIANAISSTGLDEALCCHPKSFLFLGLTYNGKADLVKALSHLFESKKACESIIQINMEDYMDCDSLMQFMDRIAALALDGSSGTDSSLSDCAQTSPYRVLLIDRVGEAHLSVFGALLSLLDHGVLRNREGKLVDFCKTVVIIMSDIGNKEILAGLGGHAMGSIIKEENANQGTEKPFRYELLNQMDEIVMFDPLLEPQLQKFYRLRITIEQVLERRLDLFSVLDYLSVNLDDLPAEKKKLVFKLVVVHLSREIAGSWNATVVIKRKFSET